MFQSGAILTTMLTLGDVDGHERRVGPADGYVDAGDRTAATGWT